MADCARSLGTPRWVKAMGLIALLLILLFVILHLMGRGMGGHGRPSHETPPPNGTAGHTPGHVPPGGLHGHAPPAGGH